MIHALKKPGFLLLELEFIISVVYSSSDGIKGVMRGI
jgi:hypothetical protein